MMQKIDRDARDQARTAGRHGTRSRRGVCIPLLLAGLLTLSACVGTPGTATDTTNSEENTMKETVLDSTAQEQTTPEVTEAPTEPVTEPTPELSDHDKLMLLLSYSEAEKALLSETAAKMSGLRITCYADKGMTQTVKQGVADPAELIFAKGSGVSAMVLEGFITFDTTGPYTDTSTKKLVDNIDASLFTDDDGTTYLIYKDGLIAPMNEDLSGFTAPFKPVYAADGLPVGFEGCSILKRNGKYYLTAATYNQSYDPFGNLITTYDSMIAVSDHLYGPYSETRLLLRNGGHNNLFVDKDGNVWTTLFAPTGQHGFHCKPAIVKLSEDERGILFVPAPDGEN